MQLVAPAPTSARRTARRGTDGPALTRMLRLALWGSAAYLCVGSIAAGAAWGLHSVPSFAAGTAAVAFLFATGLWALRLVLRGATHLAQAGAFAVFFLQMYVGVLLAVGGRQVAWVEPFPLAAGAIGATLVWQAGLIIGFATARRPVYSRDDLGAGGSGSEAAGEGGRS